MFVATRKNGNSKNILSILNPLKKKQLKVFYLNPDGSLVRMMPSSAMEAPNSTVSEFLPMALSGDEDSAAACNKVTLKTVCGTYQKFKLVANCNKSLGVNSATRQEFGTSSIDCKF